jgi:hypothetical protein
MDNNPPVEKRFIFKGAAVALAAHLRRPADQFVRAVASSCLPVTGGLAEAQAGAQNFHDFISFESASTRALGDYADTRRAADFTHGNHGQNELPTNTFVETSISGLKVDAPPDAGIGRRVFVAKQLHLRLESTSDRRNHIAFRSLDASFTGVSVDGVALNVHTATEVFSQNETKEKLVKRFEDDGDFRKRYANLFFPTGEPSRGLVAGLLAKHEIPNSKGTIFGTVVTGLEWQGKKPDKADVIGTNQLKIEGLGTVYFGEIFVDENFRRVTLLRFQLGSNGGGDMSVCDGQANGDTWPPSFSGL